MPLRRAALDKIKEGLAAHLGVKTSDVVLEAIAVAYLDAAQQMYHVTASGYGSVRIYIEQGWLLSSAMELTTLPDPANRRLPGPGSGASPSRDNRDKQAQ